VLTGQVISHYRLLDAIARDRDSVIYRARDLRLDRDVAIRILSGPDADKPPARERFRREARIASLVTHPHICAVHDSGEEDGHAFVVCELLEGRPLEELLVIGPLPLDRVVELGIQMIDALAALHARGLVHGNLTPANVFVTTEDHVKLLDVGLMTAWWETTTMPTMSNDSSPTLSLDRRAISAAQGGAFPPYRSPE
jgi:serine/threonine protein kinase